MRSLVSPSHPLIQAFLLQQEAFQDTKNIIVETDADALKLKNYLDALPHRDPTHKTREYQIISGYHDILRTLHYTEMVGIYSAQTALHPPANTDIKSTGIIMLKQDIPLSEKELISWLTDNGYEAKKGTDINTYLRQGDTISIQTTRGLVQVSFFGGKIENIYLDTKIISSYTLISLL